MGRDRGREGERDIEKEIWGDIEGGREGERERLGEIEEGEREIEEEWGRERERRKYPIFMLCKVGMYYLTNVKVPTSILRYLPTTFK